MSELNLENAFCELIIKALNKYEWKTHASKELGVDIKTLNNLIPKYNIIKDNGQYIKQNK